MEKRAESGDSAAYDAFKRVRNRLQKHYPEEIVLACIQHLMAPDASSVEHLRHYPPWVLLLLIKWTVLYGDTLSPNRRHLVPNDFNYLVNLMHDLSGLVRMPRDYDSAALFLRTMAFQQFWLQERISLPRPARQSLIFGHLQKNHPFRRAFSEHTGMTIEHFIELEIALLTRFLTGNEPFVTAGWFRSIEPSYPPGTVQTFLSMLSLNLDSLRNYLTETDSASASISYQFYERTPLSRYPLLEYGTNYYCYNKTLLFYALQGFIYDLLRAQDPNAFMNKFGPVFEKYVGRSLACSGVPFLMSRAV